jgi:hypothetical protein
MKLSEFVGTDHPDNKINVSAGTMRDMVERKDEIDTSAFLYCYRQTTKHILPPIAAERALARDWGGHPMGGIGSPDCKDKWARAYQEASLLSDEIFDILQERALYR